MDQKHKNNYNEDLHIHNNKLLDVRLKNYILDISLQIHPCFSPICSFLAGHDLHTLTKCEYPCS